MPYQWLMSRLIAEEAAALSDAELGRQRLDARALGPVADDDEKRVGSGEPELRERPDEVVRPLDRRQTPCPSDDERVWRDIERRSPTSSFGVVGPRQTREVEPVRDHDDLLSGCDAEPDEIVAHLVAHGHDRPRPPCEQTLERG